MQTVAVFFGGRSAEHDVSIVTALVSVIKPLRLSGKYHVLPVYIAKTGAWYCGDEYGDIALYSSGDIDEKIRKDQPIAIDLSKGLHVVLGGKFRMEKRIRIDIAFPAMHGTYGEDGALMGLLDMANVPYVGCDMQSSVIAMDKILTKAVVRDAGILTVPDVILVADLYSKEKEQVIDRIELSLGYPVFVKPPRLGSSIGVMKASDRSALNAAIETAFSFDDRVLVEMAVPNLREATLPIMGYKDDIVPALLEEPLLQGDEYFDFDVKYLRQGKAGGKGGAKAGAKLGAQGYSRLPADLPKKLYDSAQAVAIEGYKIVGCSGIARVDILINSKTKQVYFNEINPMPGSLYAHNWASAGVSNIELVEMLIQYARQKHADREQLTTAFETNFLQQF